MTSSYKNKLHYKWVVVDHYALLDSKFTGKITHTLQEGDLHQI